MKPILLCIHGWGGSKESFNELRAALKDTPIEILTPDLPGFGAEPDPTEPWGIDEYAEWIERRYSFLVDSLLDRETSQRANSALFLLGHSLGGQIAVKLALRGNLPIHHLFLCAPAAIRPHFSLRRTTGYIIAKCGRAILQFPGLKSLQPLFRKILYKLMGIHDYERASPIMQKTMIRVTHQDLTGELHKIHTPTDLFWGTADTLTPLWKGKKMHALIPGSHLHIFEGKRHGIHETCATEIAAVIRGTMGIP